MYSSFLQNGAPVHRTVGYTRYAVRAHYTVPGNIWPRPCDNIDLAGDINGDDYGNLCGPGFNNSGNIDFADLAILKSMFFGPPGPSGLVP